MLWKLHAELIQGLLEFRAVDRPRTVLVKMLEHALPVLGFVSISLPPSTKTRQDTPRCIAIGR